MDQDNTESKATPIELLTAFLKASTRTVIEDSGYDIKHFDVDTILSGVHIRNGLIREEYAAMREVQNMNHYESIVQLTKKYSLSGHSVEDILRRRK